MPTLTSYLEDMLSNGTDADVVLQVGVGANSLSIHAHSLILQRAEYFRIALSSGFREGLSKTIMLEDVDPHLASILIKALYTDSLPNPPGATSLNVLEMLALCRRFMFPSIISSGLMSIAEKRLVLGENALTLLAKAYDLDLLDAVDRLLSTIRLENININVVQRELVGSNADRDGIGIVTSTVKARLALCKRLTCLLKGITLPPGKFASSKHLVIATREVAQRNPFGDIIQGHQEEVQECATLYTQEAVDRGQSSLAHDFAKYRDLFVFLGDEMHASSQVLLALACSSDDTKGERRT